MLYETYLIKKCDYNLPLFFIEIFNLACDIYTKKFTNISIKIMNHVILRGHNHSNITLTAKKKLVPIRNLTMLYLVVTFNV